MLNILRNHFQPDLFFFISTVRFAACLQDSCYSLPHEHLPAPPLWCQWPCATTTSMSNHVLFFLLIVCGPNHKTEIQEGINCLNMDICNLGINIWINILWSVSLVFQYKPATCKIFLL